MSTQQKTRRGFIAAASGAVSLLSPIGRALAADAPPGNRVVCVSKQMNEFIYAIGAESHLVARDLTSIYPKEILKLPNVGYHRALSAEGIVSMRPSVLLTDGNVGPNEVLERVRSVGVPIVTMAPGDTLEGSQALMIRLGDYFGRRQAAAEVVAKWKAGLAAITANAARWNGTKKPRVLMMHMGQIAGNYLGISRGSPGDQVIAWSGGENAMDKEGGMTRLTPELISKSAPDVIIATDVGYDRYGSAAKFATLPGDGLTPAGKSRRIYRVDETEIMYFGPRTAASVKKITQWLHPA